MALIVTRDEAGTDEVQFNGAGTPVQKNVTLDGTGGTEVTDTKTFYLQADGGMYYENISLALQGEVAGRDWELSLNETTWLNTIEPADMDATSEDQTTPFYIRCTVTNDGGEDQPETDVYTEVDVRLTATELESAPE